MPRSEVNQLITGMHLRAIAARCEGCCEGSNLRNIYTNFLLTNPHKLLIHASFIHLPLASMILFPLIVRRVSLSLFTNWKEFLLPRCHRRSCWVHGENGLVWGLSVLLLHVILLVFKSFLMGYSVNNSCSELESFSFCSGDAESARSHIGSWIFIWQGRTLEAIQIHVCSLVERVGRCSSL